MKILMTSMPKILSEDTVLALDCIKEGFRKEWYRKLGFEEFDNNETYHLSSKSIPLVRFSFNRAVYPNTCEECIIL